MRVHWTLWIERPIFKTWPEMPEMLGSNLSVGSHSGGGGEG